MYAHPPSQSEAAKDLSKLLPDWSKNWAHAAVFCTADYLQSLDTTKWTHVDLLEALLPEREIELFEVATDIEWLNLCDTNLNDYSSRNLKNLSALRNLGVANTSISGASFQHIPLSGLQHLACGPNLTDYDLASFPTMPDMWSLSISGPAITDSSMEIIVKKAPALEYVYLRDSAVSSKFLNLLSRNSQIRRVSIYNSPITREQFREYAMSRRYDIESRDFYFHTDFGHPDNWQELQLARENDWKMEQRLAYNAMSTFEKLKYLISSGGFPPL